MSAMLSERSKGYSKRTPTSNQKKSEWYLKKRYSHMFTKSERMRRKKRHRMDNYMSSTMFFFLFVSVLTLPVLL